VCVCVCVCVRERERERGHMSLVIHDDAILIANVNDRCVYERVCVCVRERECECVFVCLC